MARTGRPRTQINWEEFDKLCTLHCTLSEIAAWFKCDEKTIETACLREKKQTFSDYYKSASATGKMSLRRWQMKAAEKGNPAMLIWMGKQLLGQKDKSTVEHEFSNLSDADLISRATSALGGVLSAGNSDTGADAE